MNDSDMILTQPDQTPFSPRAMTTRGMDLPNKPWRISPVQRAINRHRSSAGVKLSSSSSLLSSAAAPIDDSDDDTDPTEISCNMCHNLVPPDSTQWADTPRNRMKAEMKKSSWIECDICNMWYHCVCLPMAIWSGMLYHDFIFSKKV